MSAPLRKGWCPGALRPMPAKDGLLVRLRITGGILPTATAHALAALAARCGNGLFDLSARANLQMRGVQEGALPKVQDGLAALGLLDASAGAESVRNVIASPLAGLHDGLDIRPLTAALEQRLAGDADLHALPAKFGFLIDDGGMPSLAGVAADVRFDWMGDGFAIGLGGTRDEAVRVAMCEADDLEERAARVARGAIDLFGRHPKLRRMRELIAVLDRSTLSAACAAFPFPAGGRRWPPSQRRSDEGPRLLTHLYPASGESPHPTLANARATFSRKREKDIAHHDPSHLRLAAPFGRLDTAMLHAAADVAAATADRELRLTPWRAILVPGAARRSVPGFVTDPVDPRLRIVACVGSDGCEHGTTSTRLDAEELAAGLYSSSSDDILVHVSGCEKGCAKASPTPVTLVAREGRYDLVRNGCAGDRPVARGLDLTAARVALASALGPV